MAKAVIIYDASLREGAQGAGASFSVKDKLRIVNILDGLGVPYIEAGNPGSNPKDEEFYRQVKLTRVRAKLCAFGAAARLGIKPADDPNILALLRAETPVVTPFGKAWDLHVTQVLKGELSQNLDAIAETVAYLIREGREVCFDAEHFFDGAKNNEAYAFAVLETARQAGARWLCLCDTNGGCFPDEVDQYVREAVRRFGADCLGIHAHNDTGMAEANTVVAVRAGCAMAQVTANGLGERCGNADLFTAAPNLQLKLGIPCIPEKSMARLKQASIAISNLMNTRSDPRKPYVGKQAFMHKAGMHIDGVQKNPASFEHMPPESVGNERAFVLSEIAGRAAVLEKIQRILPDLDKSSPELNQIVERLKRLEYEGYQYESADASFELEVRRMLRPFPSFFQLRNFKVIVTEPAPPDSIATAMIDLTVGGEQEITAANGNGPVNALDAAARKALERFYPGLGEVELTDYRVRVLDGTSGTGSRVRVLIESRDRQEHWTTVGVSGDVIGASWIALTDSLEYKLLKDNLHIEEENKP